MKNPPTAPPARDDGLRVWTTEIGHALRVEAGPLAVTVEGCLDADDAASAVTAALDQLALRRGRQPANPAERTAPRLLDALREP